MLNKKSNSSKESQEVKIIESPNIIGEYFYDNSTKRSAKAVTIPEEDPTLLLSI